MHALSFLLKHTGRLEEAAYFYNNIYIGHIEMS